MAEKGPVIIRSGEIDADVQAKLEQKGRALQAKIARALETARTEEDWFSEETVDEEDLPKERRKHTQSAFDTLRKLMQGLPAGPEPGAVSYEKDPS